MSAPIPLQQDFWNDWNARHREFDIPGTSLRQSSVILGWLERMGRRDLRILEVGCGAGWFCPQLAKYGKVSGTDLSDEVLVRAQARHPEVKYVAGDFMKLDLGRDAFDVVVALEVLSHVDDQESFIRKVRSHLRPGGVLMMATQNRFVFEHFNRVPPPGAGQIRKWLDRRQLHDLLSAHFDVRQISSVFPMGDRGIMRVVNSRKLNRPVRAVFGDRFERMKEAVGLGSALMALAMKPE